MTIKKGQVLVARTDIPWDILENEYVYSKDPVSIETLSKRYGVSNGTIAKHSKRGEWVRKRRAAQGRAVSTRFEQKLIEDMGIDLTLEDSATLAAKTLTDVLIKFASRVSSLAFNSDVDTMKAETLLSLLSSITNSLERIVRTVSAMRDPRGTATDTLLDILSANADRN